MNPQRLLQHFDTISEAPDAVAKLRRFILNLAVRGKLVEQDGKDEPACVLLSRIHEQFSAKKNIGKSFSAELPTVDRPRAFGEMPSGWRPAKFGALILRSDAGWSPKSEGFARSEGKWGVLKVSAVSWGKFRPEENKQLLPGVTPPDSAVVKEGDFLISRANTSELVAKCVIVEFQPERLILSDKIVRLYLTDLCNKRFFQIVNNVADFSRAHYAKCATGVSPSMKNVTRSAIYDLVVPVPPLAEQHRIVAKVDELMELCDQLQGERDAREQQRDLLVAASLHRLVVNDTGDDNGATESVGRRAEYTRFHLQHLARFTTCAEQITQLRKTIRNLAIRGKLVPQHLDDEPASELMRCIAEEKAQLLSDRGRTKARSILFIQNYEAPFVLPENWVMASLGEVVISRDGERVPVSKEERNGRAKLFDYYGASGVIDKIDSYLFDKPLLLIGEDGANLINRSTPIAYMARGNYWVNNHAHVLDGISEGLLLYLELFINAIDLKPYVTGAAQPKMNQAKMNSIPIAVPPLAEQHRIVARVDELMALCDQLEASVAAAQTDRSRLLDALLHEALAEGTACRSITDRREHAAANRRGN